MEKLEGGTLPTTILHHLGTLDGDACLTMDALETALGLTRRQISNASAQLVLRGLLERVERGCFQLTDEGKKAAVEGKVIKSGPWRPDTASHIRRHKDTFRQRVWNALRMAGIFTISDVVMAAARADDKGAESNAARYLRQLKHAGYLAELPTRQAGTRLTSNGFKRFRLLRNSGPLAPVYKGRRQAIYDLNTREDWPCAPNLS